MTNTNIQELIDALGWRDISIEGLPKECGVYLVVFGYAETNKQHEELLGPNFIKQKISLCTFYSGPEPMWQPYVLERGVWGKGDTTCPRNDITHWQPLLPPPGQPTEAQQIIAGLVEIAQGYREALEDMLLTYNTTLDLVGNETFKGILLGAGVCEEGGEFDHIKNKAKQALLIDILEAFTQDKTSEVE